MGLCATLFTVYLVLFEELSENGLGYQKEYKKALQTPQITKKGANLQSAFFLLSKKRTI